MKVKFNFGTGFKTVTDLNDELDFTVIINLIHVKKEIISRIKSVATEADFAELCVRIKTIGDAIYEDIGIVPEIHIPFEDVLALYVIIDNSTK